MKTFHTSCDQILQALVCTTPDHHVVEEKLTNEKSNEICAKVEQVHAVKNHTPFFRQTFLTKLKVGIKGRISLVNV